MYPVGESFSGSGLVIDSRVSQQARTWVVPLFVGLGAYAIAVIGAVGLLNDGDTLSHIVIGRWIIEHHALPFHDPFSYTILGGTWVPHEWLAEVIFAALYDWLGWGGVIAATALAIAAAFTLLTRALASPLGARRAAIGAVLAFLVTLPHLLARPHVLAYPLLVIWMSGVIGARDSGRVPPLALLPVMILWCNLHGGFVVGLLFAGLLAAEAVLEAPPAARWQAAKGWGVFLVLSTFAALVSPNRTDALLLPLRMLRMGFAMSSISEWHGADFSHFEPLEVWIVLAILGGFSLGLRLPWTRTAMVLVLLHLALTHVRNRELVGLVVPLLVAAPLATQLGLPAAAPNASGQRRGRSGAAKTPLAAAGAVTIAVALALSLTAVALDRRHIHPPEYVAPVAAVAAARQAGLSGHVLNSLRFGGYLMFEGIPTFIDGRADLFGDAFLARYAAAINGVGDTLPGLLDRYAVAWTLFEPQSPAVTQLDHLPGWERVYSGKYAVIQRRTPPHLGGTTPRRALKTSPKFFETTAVAGD